MSIYEETKGIVNVLSQLQDRELKVMFLPKREENLTLQGKKSCELLIINLPLQIITPNLGDLR